MQVLFAQWGNSTANSSSRDASLSCKYYSLSEETALLTASAETPVYHASIIAQWGNSTANSSSRDASLSCWYYSLSEERSLTSCLSFNAKAENNILYSFIDISVGIVASCDTVLYWNIWLSLIRYLLSEYLLYKWISIMLTLLYVGAECGTESFLCYMNIK